MAYQGGVVPHWLSGQYPGLEGMNIANQGFKYLLNDPAFGQLTASAAADQPSQQFQAETASGLPASSAAGAFGRVLAGNMGASVAGQSAQDTARLAAQNARVQNSLNAANLMGNQESAQNTLAQAKTKNSLSLLGLGEEGLKLLVNPDFLGFSKGLFSNITNSYPSAAAGLGIKDSSGGSGTVANSSPTSNAAPAAGLSGAFGNILGGGGEDVVGASEAGAGTAAASDAAAGGSSMLGSLFTMFPELVGMFA